MQNWRMLQQFKFEQLDILAGKFHFKSLYLKLLSYVVNFESRLLNQDFISSI